MRTSGANDTTSNSSGKLAALLLLLGPSANWPLGAQANGSGGGGGGKLAELWSSICARGEARAIVPKAAKEKAKEEELKSGAESGRRFNKKAPLWGRRRKLAKIEKQLRGAAAASGPASARDNSHVFKLDQFASASLLARLLARSLVRLIAGISLQTIIW